MVRAELRRLRGLVAPTTVAVEREKVRRRRMRRGRVRWRIDLEGIGVVGGGGSVEVFCILIWDNESDMCE